MINADASSKKKEGDGREIGNRVLIIGKDHELRRSLEESPDAQNCRSDHAAGSADALRHLRAAHYDVVITNPATSIEEDLALLSEMRAIRPGVRVIMLAPSSSPEEVIAALRARAFVCLTPPFDADQIAGYAFRAAAATDSLRGIEVVSARRDWVSLRVNCHRLTADRVVSFLNEMQGELPEAPREELMTAFREILMNAIEHGAALDPGKVVEVAAVHTDRAIVFYVRDPGPGFDCEALPQAAVSNPENDPTAHMQYRAEQGMRPGGFGILVARGIVDELMYSDKGNEVLLIKYTI